MGKQIVSAAPGSAGIDWNEFEGKLFVFEPLEVEKDIETVHGTTDAIRANAYVILSKDGSKSEDFEDTLVFPRVLQGQLRKACGTSLVVGRLTKGEKKPGKNAPWTLAEASAADLKAASAFWSAKSLSSAGADEDEGYDDDEDGDDAF